MKSFKKRNGFSVAEVLISVFLLGTLSAMLYPMVLNGAHRERFATQGRNAISGISNAYTTFQKQNSPTAATTVDQVVTGSIPYMRRIMNDANSYIQVNTSDGSACFSSNCSQISCTGSHHCLLLQDSGLLMYTTGASFGGNNPTQNALHFLYDPDAEGPQPAESIVVFFNGRTTTQPFAQGAVFNGDNLSGSNTDPDYISSWTQS